MQSEKVIGQLKLSWPKGFDAEKLHESFPDWGPYSKWLGGASHLLDRKKGIMVDFAWVPSLTSRRSYVPHLKWDSDFYPESAESGLKSYSFRHKLSGTNGLSTLSAFTQCKGGIDYKYSFENKSQVEFSCEARLLVCIRYPSFNSGQDMPLPVVSKPSVPGIIWIDSLDYYGIEPETSSPLDRLVPDGHVLGELHPPGAVEGSALGHNFWGNEGDKVYYRTKLTNPIDPCAIGLRYRSKGKGSILLKVNSEQSQSVSISSSEEFCCEYIYYPQGLEGEIELELESSGIEGFELDGIVIGDEKLIPLVEFNLKNQSDWPEIDNLTAKSLTLNYPVVSASYNIEWSHPSVDIRRITASEIESLLKRTVNEHTWEHITNVWNSEDNKGITYLIMDFKDIVLEPGESYSIYGKIQNQLKNNTDLEKAAIITTTSIDPVQITPLSTEGKRYQQGARALAAGIRTNMVFPLLRGGEFIPQISPGKWWDSLYTWDAGFVGLGLQGMGETKLATALLATYLTNPKDPQRPFIHHGTPVPVQIYLFRELWQNSDPHGKRLLQGWIPSLERMHNFLIGRNSYSTTDRFQSGLIQTWDYFYNGGGWDDYPPQKYMHQQKLTSLTSPVATSAHLIRTAKILLQMSECTGQEVDRKSLEADIKRLSAALKKHSWDEESSYFGYVIHDNSGTPKKLLKLPSGENLNKGMGGIYPLITGECSTEIENQLIKHLENPNELWTDYGWSTVDQSASYYSSNGYWNGAVWYPHAWFFWKRLLDMGKTTLAWKMAEAALKTWQKEIEQSNRCFEHFRIDTGRGAGWHQFSSLNVPVLLWYKAYFAPGSVTTGFDALVLETKTLSDRMEITVYLTGSESTLLVVPKTEGPLHIQVDGKNAAVPQSPSGVLEIPLKRGIVNRNVVVIILAIS